MTNAYHSFGYAITLSRSGDRCDRFRQSPGDNENDNDGAGDFDIALYIGELNAQLVCSFLWQLQYMPVYQGVISASRRPVVSCF
jgi:hypothetical protein